MTNSTSTTMSESKDILIIKCIFVFLFIFPSLIGNGSVIFTVLQNKNMRTIPNLFILNLAITDFSFASTGMPTIIVTALYRTWALGVFLCEATGVLNTLFTSVSIWTLVMISVNRLIAVLRPLQLKTIYTRRNTYYNIFAVWFVSLQFAYAPIFGWGSITPGDNYCTINVRDGMSYAVFYTICCFMIPGTILPVIYLVLLHLIKKKRRKQQEISRTSNVKGEDHKKRMQEKANVVNLKLIKMIFAVIVGFYCCWMPIVVGTILYGLKINTGRFHSITLGVMCACLNSAINPFIYAVMNKSFRRAFLNIFLLLKSKITCNKKEVELKPSKTNITAYQMTTTTSFPNINSTSNFQNTP